MDLAGNTEGFEDKIPKKKKMLQSTMMIAALSGVVGTLPNQNVQLITCMDALDAHQSWVSTAKTPLAYIRVTAPYFSFERSPPNNYTCNLRQVLLPQPNTTLPFLLSIIH